ncbi:unnamed protein product [Dimorphilus gyrociliatus]|uniref:NACHT domain-containing protein n=1 Tax=Dimorphilus gyrociliatus TaxID=2664684 RepID=A0A7I8WFQ1_9ANNE|nr:unnamed protein product [Dimorphilus gyrociliatus]
MNTVKCQRLSELINNTWTILMKERKNILLKDLETIPKFPFLKENPSQINFSKIFTPIQLVSSKSNLVVDENFDDVKSFQKILIDEENKRILIRGDAGMGKTYHAMKILHSWVHDDTFLDNCLLLYIKLGAVQRTACKESLVDELFTNNFKRDSCITKELFQYFFEQTECKEKMILLLDGADELKYEDSIFNDIVKKCNFTIYPVIVWARNWKIRHVSDTYDFVFDINGFNERQLKIYFEKFFNEDNLPDLKLPFYHNKSHKKLTTNCFHHDGKVIKKSDILFQMLKTENKEVFNICNSPLIACLVAGIWEETDTDIIGTRYSIFDQSIQILLTKAGIDSKSNDYTKILEYCSKLAFENLLYNKEISINEIVKKSDYIGGLLIPVKKKSSMTQFKEFTFIHIFFQEYLTARYIINLYQDSKKNESIIQSLKTYFDKLENLFLLKNVFSFLQEINYKVFSQIIEENKNILMVLETDQRIIDIINRRHSNLIELESISLPTTIINIIFNSYKRNIKEIISNLLR